VTLDYRKIRIKNFKSLEDIQIELKKLNVVVGPNGSGKTNLIEAFLFLQWAVRPAAFPPYPFTHWWGYRNMVYLHDVNKNIEFFVEGSVSTSENRHEQFDYQLTVNGAGDVLKILEERLSIGNGFVFQKLGNELKVITDQQTARYQLSDLRYSLFNIVPMLAVLTDLQSGKQRLVLQVNTALAKGEPQLSIEADQNLIRALTEVHRGLFSDIRVLRFNPTLARSPSPPGTPLTIEGLGLSSAVYSLYAGLGAETRSKRYLDYFLDKFNLRLQPYLTELQTVSMKIVEDGLLLEPPGIPDGYLKAIALMYLLDTRPSLLLVDEVENHMHLKFIEHIISSLRASETKAIVTTHSPLVVDLAEPEELIVMSRKGSSTAVKTIEDPETLKNELIEKGITLSESWLYGNLSD
jgi:Fe-S cluster assembly ATPase SufC